ncbi:APC family permease [Kistimonas scapharcae]|uniref:APC family permease n=1 Tax=Kistimonas scapharcae TaxID=1036133 RepID=A0ABP8V4F5_9GAMM
MSTSKKSGLGLVGIIFFILSGLIGIDGLTASAAVGPSVFGWWVLILLCFVLPYVLIVCELGSAFPGEGGVYDWTLLGLGERNAARVGWYYWINVPLWMPSVYLICAGMIAELFFPGMSTWGMIAIALVMVWITIFTANASLDIGNLINTLGGLSKVLVLLAMAVGGLFYIGDHGAANELTLSSMMPSMDASFMYAPTLIYMLIGAETIACMGSSIRNPQRDLPLGIMLAMGIIVLLYWAAISSMMTALPLEELSLVGGIVQTFNVLFGDSNMGTLLTITLSLVAIFGLFTYLIPWIMAASRAAMEAANNHEMPAIFARKNAHGAPQGANMMTGYVATVALVLYGFMAGNADDLFWSLFAFANFLLFITYFFFFGAFVKLRQKEPNAVRPFRVPCGDRMAVLVALLPAVVLLFGCVLFVFPDILGGDIDWAYSGPTVIGIVAAMIFIEVSITRLKQGSGSETATAV